MRFEEIERRANRALQKKQRDLRRRNQETPSVGKEIKRMYQSAKMSRLTADWTPSNTSADSEIRSSLTTLRARCRSLDRDSSYAKRAKHVVVNNVVGSGIGMQAQVRSSRNRFVPRVNDAIEEEFKRWWLRPEYCHTGGTLASGAFERAVMMEVFEAGEVFIRQHFTSFGGSPVPYALELVESERVPHGIQPESVRLGAETRMGVEVDKYYRPLAFYIRDHHPSDFHYPAGVSASEVTRRVPASEVIHLRIVERWPQTRGVPWLHAVAKILNDMAGYSEAELVAARGAANYMASIETDPMAQIGEEQPDGTRQVEVSPGIVVKLAVGEKLNFHSPNRPNAALDSFMRYMLRETAAGANVSYEAISRDYSQSNYSSSRLSLLDDRDSWRCLQTWFLHSFRAVVHRNWLQQAVLSRIIPAIPVSEYAVNREKYEAVKFKPRGWSWVDPTKEVAAFKEAERAGYITKTQIIAQTAGGQDFEDVLDEREAELQSIEEHGLQFDTDSPVEAPPKQATPGGEEDDTENDDGADADEQDDDDDEDSGQMRLVK